jgi:hypothetical protein
MEQFLKSDGQNSVSELIDSCISDWLSQSIDKSKLYEDLEGKTAGIILRGKITQLPAVPDAILKPHPTIAELSLIEEVSEGESRERSNPGCPAMTVSKPQEVSANHLNWIKSLGKKK